MLTLRNPVGLGIADLVELALAALLVVMALGSRPWIEPVARKLAVRTGWCMLLLAIAPIALRLALLPHHPVPSPAVYDEFGHLLVADTIAQFRLANPPHPLHQFFETFFVLQTPSYASIYPIGQGFSLALGRAIFGLPWAGALLTTAAMCSLCYWALLGWTTPVWALAGGVLAIIEFGPTSAWMNSYWGGSLAAVAGCLAFGALPRIRATGRARHGALLGVAIGLHWHIRPYETIFLVLSAIAFLLPRARSLARPALAAIVALLPAIALFLIHNKQVTGSWTTLPYSLSRYQYGVPAAFTWQQPLQPHRELTREQEMQYKMQNSFRAAGPETLVTFLQRLGYRVRFYRFFFLPALYVALPFALTKLRDPRLLWLVLTLLLFALGVNFYPFFETHYLGALACLLILLSITGLQQLPAFASRLILFLCAAHFLFWYSRGFFDQHVPDRRSAVVRQLASAPGKQLIFVRYWPQHIFQDEWVYNDADIDTSRIVWARDLGAGEDQKLLRYYPNRTAWLLEPDASPPRLGRYVSEAPKPVRGAQPPAPPEKTPPLRFEEVH